MKNKKFNNLKLILLIIVTIAIVFVGGGVAARKWFFVKPPVPVSVVVVSPETSPLSVQPKKNEPVVVEIKKNEAKEVLTNPFTSPLQNKQQEEEIVLTKSKALSLTGILYQEDRVVAIINNKIVRVGDLIEGRKIIAINRKSVVVKEAEIQYIIKIR